MQKEEVFWKEVFRLAKKAEKHGEIPVGAVVVRKDKIIGKGHNRQLLDNDPTAHAEIVALRNASRLEENFRLDGAVLYSTIKPCPMCREAVKRARIASVYYAAGEARPATHKVKYVRVEKFSKEGSNMIKEYFNGKRND